MEGIPHLCPMRLNCNDYHPGHKRRSHHVRLVSDCVRIENETCPMLGSACEVAKHSNRIKELKERNEDICSREISREGTS